MRTQAKWVWLASALALSACGDNLSGTYSDGAGVTQYEFAEDGNVNISVLGSDVVAEYRIDGDKILVSSAQGTVVLTRRGDRLYGPMGLQLTRKSDNP
ncbi:MAG: hypothetical protein WBN31_02725 [Gammaproteobacteria bacterium]